MIIDDLIFKLRQASQDIKTTVIRDAVIENEAIILDMNTQDQLFEKGITADNISIASYQPYRPNTITIKALKGQPTNRVTLKDEGDFYRSFYLEYYDDRVFITAGDDKAEKLAFKYGERIFGLTEENKTILAKEYIKPILIDYLKNIFTV